MTNQHQKKPFNKNQPARKPHPLNNAMADQLRGFKAQNNNGYPGQKKLIDLKGDGIDHINIYQDPQTKVGKILSPFTERHFTIPLHGRFNSRQGLYHYLLSSDGDESYRTMKPAAMLKYSYRTNNRLAFYPNLRYFMAQALCAQIKNDDNAQKLIFNNELPFEAYFTKYFEIDGVNNYVPTRTSNSRWVVEIAEAVSHAIQSGEELDMQMFIDRPADLEELQNKILRNPIAQAAETPPPKKKKKPSKNKDVTNSQSVLTNDETADTVSKSYFETDIGETGSVHLMPKKEESVKTSNSYYDAISQAIVYFESAVDGDLLQYLGDSDKTTTELGIGKVMSYSLNKPGNEVIKLDEPVTLEDLRVVIAFKNVEDVATEFLEITTEVQSPKEIVNETPEVQAQETEATIVIERRADGELYFSETKEETSSDPAPEQVSPPEDKVLTDIPKSVYVPKYPTSL